MESCDRGHKGGVDAKELFHLYVVLWIQEKRLNLLDFCKFDKVSWQCLLCISQAFYCVIYRITSQKCYSYMRCMNVQERCTWVTTQHSTSPFVEEVYERIKETLNEYEIIIHRWPEYIFSLEHVSTLLRNQILKTVDSHFTK